MKYLDVNLTKQEKQLYTKKHEMLMNKTKGGLNKYIAFIGWNDSK